MSDIKDLPKSLPSMDFAFNIDVEGAVTRKRYQGDFLFRIPTAGQRSRADIELAKMNDGIPEFQLDESTRLFHRMVSYLRHTLVEVPKWWQDAENGYNIYDGNVVTEIYTRISDFEIEWTKKVWGEDEQPAAKKSKKQQG